MPKPLVMISAGGTGGHLFPAEALAGILRARGCGIVLVTDNRIGELAERFPADEVVAIPAATPSGRSPLAALRAVVTLARGFFRARRLIARARPDVVVGFGGYPTVPPLLAGSLAGYRTVLHEQNGVIGRANRFLAGRVTHLASSVPELRGISDAMKAKLVMTGNPVRANVLEAAKIPYPAINADSLLEMARNRRQPGARGFDVGYCATGHPAAYTPEMRRAHSRITQQARPGIWIACAMLYERKMLSAEIAPFFGICPGRIARSHLVISRSGSLDRFGLAVIGRHGHSFCPLPRRPWVRTKAANPRCFSGCPALP